MEGLGFVSSRGDIGNMLAYLWSFFVGVYLCWMVLAFFHGVGLWVEHLL